MVRDVKLSDMKVKWGILPGLVALPVLIIAHILLLKDVEPVPLWFYPIAWWCYILIVDSLIFWRRGASLLISRPKEFCLMAAWSLIIWLFFEFVNLFIHNWYYVNVPRQLPLRWIGMSLSFATVLPLLFETAELCDELGLYASHRCKGIRITKTLLFFLSALGLAFLVLPFLFPRYFFPLIWGSFFFLLEPVNYWYGRPSLLRDWERGSLRRFFLLLTAGLWCGLLWEAWNFRAEGKWIYTVPFFEETKLFEMPLLGFLGFPPFAVECYVIYSFISTAGGLRIRSAGLPVRQAGAVILLILFVVGMLKAIDLYTVDSVTPSLSEITGIGPDSVEKLTQAGIATPSRLVRAGRDNPQKRRLIEELHLSEGDFDAWLKEAELVRLKGIGHQNVRLLSLSGIMSIEDLSRHDPERLFLSLSRVNHERNVLARPPELRKVKTWVAGARAAQARAGGLLR